jgi:hypothetical protein
VNWLYHSVPRFRKHGFHELSLLAWVKTGLLGGPDLSTFDLIGSQLHLQPNLQLVETFGFHRPFLAAFLELGLVAFLRHGFVAIQSVPLVTPPV